MLIAEPRRSEPAMLIGIRNRDEHAVDRGEWLVIAGGGQNPQAARSACASDVGGAGRRDSCGHSARAAWVNCEAGAADTSQPLLDRGKRKRNETLEIRPFARIVGAAVGGELRSSGWRATNTFSPLRYSS